MKKNINHHTFFSTQYTKYQKDENMTYILGARCSDGVVLVGDTKITMEDGADFSNAKKIFNPFNSVVFGAAGFSGLYKAFQNRLDSTIMDMGENGERISTSAKFSVITENVIREMHEIYGDDKYILRNLSVLMATRIGYEAELVHFQPIGFPEPVNDYKVIGHGEPYGSIFLKKMWSNKMNMEETALIGCFILKIIQEFKLDYSVGYSDQYLPQIWYIPDIPYPGENIENDNDLIEHMGSYPIRELGESEVLSLMNRVSKQVENLRSFFVNGELKLY
ncbi:hypothetical protein V7O62_07075 [Methanolobus sp. ZRKC2]|uniref:hypothetical protein n=1 Tax=Methanolobus sp. ZRKC2 TaxID=3125783 RepID=UPI0032477EFB